MESVSELEKKKDVLEAELEAMDSKKKRTGSDAAREDEAEAMLKRHSWHISMLEILQRRMENDMVDYEELAMTKDAIEYYVESCEEPDFYFDEEVYDIYNLDAPEPSPNDVTPRETKDDDDDDEEEEETTPPAKEEEKKKEISPDASPKPAETVPAPAPAAARAPSPTASPGPASPGAAAAAAPPAARPPPMSPPSLPPPSE